MQGSQHIPDLKRAKEHKDHKEKRGTPERQMTDDEIAGQQKEHYDNSSPTIKVHLHSSIIERYKSLSLTLENNAYVQVCHSHPFPCWNYKEKKMKLSSNGVEQVKIKFRKTTQLMKR